MIKKALFLLLLLLPGLSARSQWKEIADFLGPNPSGVPGGAGQIICDVYFIDDSTVPGPSQVGFVGTYTTLYRTSNGGSTWTPVWDSGASWNDYSVTDICFKDKLTGWFTVSNGFGNTGDACYRTTDAGETWTLLSVPNSQYGATAPYFNARTNRLIISTADTGAVFGRMEYSTDLGDSWHFLSSSYSGGLSFFSDSIGIGSGSPDGTTSWMLRTTDCGLTWNLMDSGFNCYQPLAIPGSPICFEVDAGRFIIRRSDDYGMTWRVMKDYGPLFDKYGAQIAPTGLGVIRGNLSRLYIQVDSGMYISTDTGITWIFNGGPARADDDAFFYAAHGRTIAGKTYSTGALLDGGLWEEIWPQASVAKVEPSTGSLTVYPNPVRDALTISPGPIGSVQLLDALGRMVLTTDDDGTGATLDVASLRNGTYFLRVGSSFGKIEVEH